MNDDSMKLFVELSAFLTGIDAKMLAPDVDPIDIKTTYFNTVQAKAGPVFGQLLEIYGQNRQSPEVIANVILHQSGNSIKYLCRSIMLMWYLGSWYDPDGLRDAEAGVAAFVPSTVISAAAYTQGWTWSVAQAHPMGYSNFNFGYWSENPPSLADFIGTSGQNS
ncbi:MAG TPA: hypothetical protein VGZ73_03795 [Bryobacteraceae bacterium]|jgi:hypothetical protein|nr:hypothetical protein [Bryobacteraceae bacterium]